MSTPAPSHEEYQARKAAQKRAGQHVRLPDRLKAMLDDPTRRDELGRRAAVWVAVYRRRYGYGPTFRDLGSTLHSDCSSDCCRRAVTVGANPNAVARAHATKLVKTLARAGWLSTGTEPPSLQPGPQADASMLTAAVERILTTDGGRAR